MRLHYCICQIKTLLGAIVVQHRFACGMSAATVRVQCFMLVVIAAGSAPVLPTDGPTFEAWQAGSIRRSLQYLRDLRSSPSPMCDSDAGILRRAMNTAPMRTIELVHRHDKMYLIQTLTRLRVHLPAMHNSCSPNAKLSKADIVVFSGGTAWNNLAHTLSCEGIRCAYVLPVSDGESVRSSSMLQEPARET
jgi:hypothetical protein